MTFSGATVLAPLYAPFVKKSVAVVDDVQTPLFPRFTAIIAKTIKVIVYPNTDNLLSISMSLHA